MSEILFISDLHLSPARPEGIELFIGFLRQRARQAEALYILGDLFDAWIGDDDDAPPYRQIRGALHDYSSTGHRCLIMRGNRDFLLGKRFAGETGCALLSDPTRLCIDTGTTLLMHGDLLCTDDIAYQRFRRRVRNPLVTWLFLRKPLSARRRIAADYRSKSSDATAEKQTEIMDVNQEEVAKRMRRAGAIHLIHGHTHRPAEHRFELGGRMVRRSVLAEWTSARGQVLVFDGTNWRRERVTV